MNLIGSKDTIQWYLRKDLGLKPYHQRKFPLLTQKQVKAQLSFCLRLRHWTSEDWKQEIFSDESPFELFSPPNPKKIIDLDPWPSTGWIQGSAQIQSKNYGMVGNVLFWPLWPPHWLQGTIVDQHYYCDNILKGILFERMKKIATLGSKFAIKLVPNMSKMNFQQGGACPHTALRTQRMLREKIPKYWDKGIWPANSPDLSPIEQLWSILGNKLEEMKPQPKNIASLERALTNAWKLITKETLQNLIQSMSSRIQAVIEAKGSYPLL